MPTLVGPRKVRYSREEITKFNASYPCSTLRDSRAYWFEFDESGDLVDTDCPEQDDGPAALALSNDASTWLESRILRTYTVTTESNQLAGLEACTLVAVHDQHGICWESDQISRDAWNSAREYRDAIDAKVASLKQEWRTEYLPND